MSASRDEGANPEEGSMKSRRPYGVACTTCRRAKMKCIASNPELDRCDRCVRLQRDCVYEPHRRGLWRRERLDKGLRDHTHGSGGDSDHPTTGLPETRETTGPPEPLVVPRRSDRHVFSGGYAVAPGGETLAPELLRSQPGTNSTQFMPQSFITKSEDTRGLSLATVLDPDKGILTAVANSDKPLDTDISKGTPWGSDDPINIGLISRPSGQYLFEGFFKHFNCLVGLLDPQLYTFSYTRGTSSLLFSIILAISARVFQPESYELIQKHSEILLGRALVACDIAIENIWAILWFATRMAASAQWNKFEESMAPGNEPLAMAQTEAQVRQRRDKERIWLALGNLDRTSSLFTDRPLATQMINKEIGARSWFFWKFQISSPFNCPFSTSFEITQGFTSTLFSCIDF
ncbi:Zn(2)-C6 fungal-type domain-containing protein [Fusarium falciforme]|uniref:Zn(2)-C6 fungal-type domain-containing protein n=1 Tax=Fusarium falciforme TaxID=195108 RepID=UPI0022FFCCC1|nr:Zn(2)-C6 fungal-type domain-containing protein [Fusarium falciforme]WAO88918.1 Zn(2)-C6 fungal-type domain-containing protein [Fusarium falciforme]